MTSKIEQTALEFHGSKLGMKILESGLEDARNLAEHFSDESAKALCRWLDLKASDKEQHAALRAVKQADERAYQALNVWRVLRLANNSARGLV